MKERFLESFAILLAGLFSAERPKPWTLGLTTHTRGVEDESAAEDNGEASAEKH